VRGGVEEQRCLQMTRVLRNHKMTLRLIDTNQHVHFEGKVEGVQLYIQVATRVRVINKGKWGSVSIELPAACMQKCLPMNNLTTYLSSYKPQGVRMKVLAKQHASSPSQVRENTVHALIIAAQFHH
jgi:hypothetical protein